MSTQLIRFGVSLPEDLIKKFDDLIKRKEYPNRSEAIRDLIRKTLIEEEIAGDQIVIGVLHLLFDHHKRDLSEKLTDIQHDHHDVIISSTHVHLDHDNCLEVIMLKGKASIIRGLSDRMIATKGVKHGQLYMTSQGSGLD
ncbi:MAG: nickel-responsive transcriptional regulator NikR [Calditrichaceae bacterium]|nr:nickel-responsive transcriptional regulator NikR [Calditrichaceae bacterium]